MRGGNASVTLVTHSRDEEGNDLCAAVDLKYK